MKRRRGRLIIPAVVLIVFLFLSCAGDVSRKDLANEYYNLGNAFYELQEYKKAAEYYEKAIALNHEFTGAGYNLVRSYIEAGYYSKARGSLQDLIERDPKNVMLLQTAAYLFHRMGDLTAAHDMYTALLDLNPYDADTLYNYAVLLFEEEDIVRAKDIISRAIDIQPKDTAILFFHGKLSYVTDEYKKAAGSLEQYTDSEPDDAQALEMLADSYAELRYFGKALEYYDRAIEVKSAAPEILFKKAKLLLVEAGEFEDGMQTLEKALKAGFADEEALQSLLENDILFGEERIKLLLQKQGLLPLFEHQDASNAQQEEDKAAAEDEEKQPSDEEKQEGETSETLP